MLGQDLALTSVATKDLKNLLKLVHTGELECPLTYQNLAMAGASYLFDDIDFLKGHDARTVKAVLVAVLAERR